MSRDRALERHLLERLVRVAKQRFDVDCGAYVGAVEERLAIGADRYGDDLHDGRDLMGELLEETPDVAGYALLELQRLGPVDDDVRDDLLHVALLGAVADHYARRARRRLVGGVQP